MDLDAIAFAEGSHLMANKRCELPAGSWRAQKKGYEEIHVPAAKVPPRRARRHVSLPLCVLLCASLLACTLSLTPSYRCGAVVSGQRRDEDPETLVAIADLPRWAQEAFLVNKVERLNRVQSNLCDAALFSNDNLLLCAPTGAGKTNVALLTMMHVRRARCRRVVLLPRWGVRASVVLRVVGGW